MKTNAVVNTVFVLSLLCTPFLSVAQACASPVVAFSEARYCGEDLVLEHNWSARNHRAWWNDRIAAFHVPYGWEVWIYEHSDFRGEHLIIHSDWNVNRNPWWRNRISSVRVVRASNHHDYHHHHGDHHGGHHGAGITIYEHDDFNGAALTLYDDWTAHDARDFWNDQISSIHIPPGYALVLFEHANFRGRSVYLDHTWSTRRASDFWNDRVSSIKVVRQ